MLLNILQCTGSSPNNKALPDPKVNSGNVEKPRSREWVRGEEGGEATDMLLSHSWGMTSLLFSQSVYHAQARDFFVGQLSFKHTNFEVLIQGKND